MARLFVAVRPPADVLARIAALPRPPEPGVRWVPPSQWHITVRFLGEADTDAVGAAMQAWARPCADATARTSPASDEPVRAVLGPVVSRLGRSVVCLPAAGLDALARSVAGATAALGEPPDPRPFRGHLTLARLGRRAACGVTGTRFEAAFAVTEVELVHSSLSRAGAHHEVIGTFAVAPR